MKKIVSLVCSFFTGSVVGDAVCRGFRGGNGCEKRHFCR